MTVSSNINRVAYTGAGTVGPFTIPYYFLENDDLLVIKTRISDGVETVLVLTTDYTLTGAGVAAGGSLTLTAGHGALAATHTISIIRDPDRFQNTDYTPYDKFPAESHERALDKLTMVLQRARELSIRSLRQPDGDAVDIGALPGATARANKALTFDANGNPLAGTLSAVSFTPTTEAFNGTGAQTAFTLSGAPSVASALIVRIDGVVQTPITDFSVSGVTLTFTTAPAAGTSNIVVQNFGIAAVVNTVGVDNVTGLSASTGSSKVGFLQSGTGAVPRTVQSKGQDVVSIGDFGLVGDDFTNNSTAIVNALTRAAGEALIVPKGTFRLNSVATLPAAGITIEGKGYDSVLKVGSANQVLLQMITGGWLRLYNIRLVGDGTSTGSPDGIGLLLSDCKDVELDTVWFEGFGWAGWRCVSLLGSIRTRIRGRNITVTGGKNPAVGENADIDFRGKFKDIRLANINLEASATTPVGNGVNIVQAAAGENWEGVSIDGIVVRGHGKRGLSIGSEIGDATFQSGKISINDAKIYNVVMSAIKTKNVDRVILSNIYAEGCDTTPEIAGNLQGSVFLNLIESSTSTNVHVYNAGTDGFRIIGRSGGNAAGAGRSKHILNGYLCDGADEAGVYVGPNVQRMVINAPQIEDTGGSGILINATTALARPTEIVINSPIITRAGDVGILALGLTGEKLGKIFINDPVIKESFAFGILSNFVDYIQVNGGSLLDNGQGGVATHGMRIGSTGRAKLLGVKASNELGVTQTHGLSIAAGNDNIDVQSCDLTNNATAAVSYVAPAVSMVAANNAGWLEGSSTYDPPSLVDGAGATTTVTVNDAVLGDFAKASFSLDLQGIMVTAWVSAANTVSVRFQNESGGTLDIGNGILRARARKG